MNHFQPIPTPWIWSHPTWMTSTPLTPLNVRPGASMAVPCMAVPSFTRCAASTLLAPGCSTASTPGCSGRRMVMPKVVPPPHHTPAKTGGDGEGCRFFCPMCFVEKNMFVCFSWLKTITEKKRERESEICLLTEGSDIYIYIVYLSRWRVETAAI